MFESLKSKPRDPPREINLPYGPKQGLKRDRSPIESSFRTIKLLESNQYDMQNPLDLKAKLSELKSKANLGAFKKKNRSVVSN